MWVSCSGSIETVKILIDAGANINLVTSGKKTSLMWACAKGNTEIVRYYLGFAGVDIHFTDEQQENALLLAVRAGNTEIVKCLLRS